jgi:putative glutamine amidotransferase
LKWSLKKAVRLAGGTPVPLRASKDWQSKTFDALIIGGGTDIHPSRYQEAPHNPDYQFDLPRDTMEDTLIQRAVKENMPLLGVCRGMQMINVSLGGSLHQEASDVLEDFLPNTKLISKIIGRRAVKFDPASRLYTIMGEYEDYRVNSIHHQAVNRLGKGLRVVAKEDNGLVQAIEAEDGVAHPFLIGVQWHPELMQHVASARRLFRRLKEVAQEFACERDGGGGC